MNTEVMESTFTARATICSILPREDGQDFTVCNRTHGIYYVKHPKPGEEYALTEVTWKKDFADVGDYDPQYTSRTKIEKRKEFTFDAKQIASDLCHGINDNGPGDASFFGVFVCNGPEPTEAELENAKARLNSYFMQTIAAADAAWSANPRHDLISGVAKRAARFMKLDPEQHDWLISYRPTVDCPVCGEKIKPGVALCKSCGAILDEAKARQFGIVRESEPQPERRAKREPAA